MEYPSEMISTTNCQTNAAKKTSCGFRCNDAVLRVPFQILTTTLLSLLLPLSFLLLARLSTAEYLLSAADIYPKPPPSAAAAEEQPPTTSLLCSLFLYSKKPTLLHFLVSIITVSSLTYALTGKSIFSSDQPLTRRRLYAAWIFLFVLQVCVGLGIEGSIAAGIDGSGFGQENGFLLRLTFFFGLHETISFWGRTVVKPVVDDTIFGYWREDGWVGKAAVGLSYGWFWWWRLREEVEALVVVPGLKRELMSTAATAGVGVADFMGWWLYYLTVSIGIVRMIRGFVFTVAIWTRRREEVDRARRPNDDKV